MGFAKYYEDNQKINDERRFLHDNNYITKSDDSIIPRSFYYCLYCNMGFPEKPQLYAHIKKAHNSVSKILLLNGQVVQGEEVYIKEIKSLIVVRYDLSESVYLNDKEIPSEQYDSDITESAEKEILHSGALDIKVGNRNWKITLLHSETIDSSKLESVIMAWSIDTQSRRSIDRQKRFRFNSPENRCLDGFYNYFIGCNAELSLKRARYEEAYQILSEFEQLVPSAKFIRKVIAFRFNWVDTLKKLCGEEDPFGNVFEFFQNLQSKNRYAPERDKEIYIEDDLENSISAILAYQAKDYDNVREYLNGFDRDTLQNMQDVNMRDRIYLLKARIAAINQKPHDARRFYDEIKNPFFDNEKNNF